MVWRRLARSSRASASRVSAGLRSVLSVCADSAMDSRSQASMRRGSLARPATNAGKNNRALIRPITWIIARALVRVLKEFLVEIKLFS